MIICPKPWRRPLIRKSTVDKIVLNTLVGVFVFSVVFFGAVHVWAYTCVQIVLLLSALSFVLARIPAWWKSDSGKVFWIVTPLNLTAVLFLALVLLQIISLPKGIVRLLSPNTASVIGMSEGLLTEPKSAYHLSLYCHATKESLIMVLAILYFYFLLLHSVKGRSQLKSLVKVVLYIGLAVCMYGLFEKLSGHNHILWWRHQSQARGFRVFGTFINPDHFAFFLNMILFLLFGHLYSLVGSRRSKRSHGSAGLLRSFLENDPGTQQIVFLSFCFGLMLLTFVLTGSRAAIFSLALSMCAVLVLLYAKTRRKSLFLLIGLLCVIVFGYGQRMGVEQAIDRFEELSTESVLEQGRMLHNRAVLPIITEYPVLGIGLGTFEYVYPRYQPAEAPGYRRELHNDWLQLMVETGAAGFLIVFAGFIFLMKGLITMWWQRNDPFAVGVGIGCIGALFASAVHSLFDFSLHIPANGITLAAVVAIGFLALHSRRRGLGDPFFYRVRTIRLWKKGNRPGDSMFDT